jgi:hypothetical protein
MRICQDGERASTTFSASVWIMKRATTRNDMLPLLPVVFGLGEIEAAAAIGVSASKFRMCCRFSFAVHLHYHSSSDEQKARSRFQQYTFNN